MINRLDLENFKSFVKSSLDIRPLTILTGLNNSGKSTVIQAINMVFTYYASQGQNIALKDHASPRLQKSKFSKNNFFKLNIKTDSLGDLDLQVNIDGESYAFEGGATPKTLPALQYISADRLGPQNILELNPEFKQSDIGTKGEFIIDYIDKNKDVMIHEKLIKAKDDLPRIWENINAWLQYISPGISLSYEIKLEQNASYPYYNKILPSETGFGLSYALPMITALLTPVHNTGSVLLLENPEGHLHPKGQASMGELISLAASTDKQIILETHSDHILNSIRVAVKEKEIDRKNVIIHFFDKSSIDLEQYTKVTPIELDKNGSLSSYPDNFLDEWSNQLSKLI